MTADDIISTLQTNDMIVKDKDNDTYNIVIDKERIENHCQKIAAKGYPQIKPQNLKWSPFILTRGLGIRLLDDEEAEDQSQKDKEDKGKTEDGEKGKEEEGESGRDRDGTLVSDNLSASYQKRKKKKVPTQRSVGVRRMTRTRAKMQDVVNIESQDNYNGTNGVVEQDEIANGSNETPSV